MARPGIVMETTGCIQTKELGILNLLENGLI
jgi:hypothetical protein